MTTQIRPLGAGTPPAGLAAAAVGSGGTFAAASYFWKITFVQNTGETFGSNEATATIVLNGSATLTWPAAPPGVTAVKVYRGTVTQTENALIATLAATATGYTDTGTAGSAGTPPSAQAFTSVTLDAAGRCAKSSTYLSGLAAGSFISALRAINSWHDCGGAGSAGADAAAEAAAAGLALQEA